MKEIPVRLIRHFSCVALLLFVSLAPGAVEIQNGASMDKVRSALGEPQGRFNKGNTTVWMYPDGTVEFKNGVVSKNDMLSEEEAKAKAAKRAKAKEAAHQHGLEAAKRSELKNEYERAGIKIRHDSNAGTYRTTSFVVHCPLDRRLANNVAGAAQSFHDHVVQRFFERGFPKPLDIYYSKTAGDSINLMRRHGKQAIDIGYGSYFHEPPAIYTHREMPGASFSGIGTVFHEIVHHFNSLYFPDCPSWFNEGMATFIGEQTRICDNKLSVGHPNPWREEILRNLVDGGEAIDVKKIVSLSNRQFYSRKDWYHFVRPLFYWLYSNNKLKGYLSAVKTKGYGLATLEKAAGMKADTINARLTAFIKKKCYAAAYCRDAGNTRNRKEAREKLEKALSIDPSYEPARVHLAEGFVEENDHELCQRALEPLMKKCNVKHLTSANAVMGRSLLVQKRVPGALESFKRCWKYAGYDEHAYSHLFKVGACYEMLGDRGSAARWYKRYLEENWQPDKARTNVDHARNFQEGT